MHLYLLLDEDFQVTVWPFYIDKHAPAQNIMVSRPTYSVFAVRSVVSIVWQFIMMCIVVRSDSTYGVVQYRCLGQKWDNPPRLESQP